MESITRRLQAKEAEIAQYLIVIEQQSKQIAELKEGCTCTKNEKNQKKENANDGKS